MKNRFEVKGETTSIYLNKAITLIDTTDLKRANEFEGTWYAHWSPITKTYYVAGVTPIYNGRRKQLFLHRWLMNVCGGLVIDHMNHDTLNNCRSNLRVVTMQQNNQNKRINKNNSTGFRGVTFNHENQKWRARVQVNKQSLHLGYFNSVSEAAFAVKKARKEFMPFSSI
ncbi:HNH endonuclease [Fictibacillus sp. JL2B1089]|uniref:HNH endonuclease n=1 Tax=Fictibacillus sp. JL2B1089 TaxID=3399565 RepID=UPI003A8ABA4B